MRLQSTLWSRLRNQIILAIVFLAHSSSAPLSDSSKPQLFNMAHAAASQRVAAENSQENVPTSASASMAAGTPVKNVTSRLGSLRLVPPSILLHGARDSQRFVVLGKFSDGLERDLTAGSTVSVSDAQVVKVSSTGRLVAIGDGRAILKAEAEGREAKAEVRVEDSGKQRSLTFARDIAGVLTNRGCNGSNCHGGVKGRGGLRLSLDASNTREDFRWIVEGGGYQVLTAEVLEPKNPRINLKDPQESLLLQKPTFSVPHGGGQRFSLGSPDYQILLNWIQSGAPYGDSDEANSPIERLEVFPSEVVLESKGKHQLLVTARRPQSRAEDMTELVRYESLDPEIAKVSPDGLVESVNTGETAVLVRAFGHVAVARVGVIARLIPHYAEVPRHNFIDEYVFAKLRKLSILPSKLSSDIEFLRRACLDLTGTLPPPARVREFAVSQDPRKRERLIDALLKSPEYVDYWTFRFADLMRVGIGGYAPDVQMSWEWVRKNVATNRPYDQVARERIAAQGYDGPSRHYMRHGELAQSEKVMAEQVRLFMGRRLDCAQCHEHPYEFWSQDQFWGLAAFFARKTDTFWNVDQVIFDDPDGPEMNYGEMGKTSLTFIKAMHPRKKQEAQPRFLDGQQLSAEARDDPRMALANWMTAHPYFAEAAVNRLWGCFFGKGIVDPVDDFRSTNPPTHPQLLEALAADFKAHGHDLKHLIRLIVSSRTYQLSSAPNPTNRTDETNYSRALPRSLDAEVLLDAISSATGVPEVFELTAGNIKGRVPLGTRAINLKLPAKYPSRFLEIYGRPFRDTLPERDAKPSLAQALHLLVGSTYSQKLTKEGGRLDQLLKRGATDQEAIEELYLATLSRFPTAEERDGLQEMISGHASRKEALNGLLWALISSREFAYNH